MQLEQTKYLKTGTRDNTEELESRQLNTGKCKINIHMGQNCRLA